MTYLQTYLPYAISALTIWITTLQGNLHRQAWLWCLLSQALYLLWISRSGLGLFAAQRLYVDRCRAQSAEVE
jgi:hypothetical protein